MTGSGTNLPTETEEPTEEEKAHLTDEELEELRDPPFGVAADDAVEADQLGQEPGDVNFVVDDSGALEPVSLVQDEFDPPEEVV